MFKLERAELVALAGAAWVLALTAFPGAGAWLEYRRAAALAEPWRLVTANFVHLSFAHAALNAAAWWAVARLMSDGRSGLGAARQAFVLLAGGVGVTLGLRLFFADIHWYRGLSGALHALFFCGVAVRLFAPRTSNKRFDRALTFALAAGGLAKLAYEFDAGSRAGGPVFSSAYGFWTVPQAHWLGALAGAAFGLAFVLNNRRARL